MGIDQTTKMCRTCNKHTVAHRPGTNHILHLLLTVLTAGLWLVIWILSAIKIGGWRCSQCGRAV